MQVRLLLIQCTDTCVSRVVLQQFRVFILFSFECNTATPIESAILRSKILSLYGLPFVVYKTKPCVHVKCKLGYCVITLKEIFLSNGEIISHSRKLRALFIARDSSAASSTACSTGRSFIYVTLWWQIL